MTKPAQFGLYLLYCNIGLNAYGLVSIALCNLSRRHCNPAILYAYAALYLGLPLFITISALAPKGTFTTTKPANRRYRRLFFFNLGLAALIWLTPVLAMLFD